MPIGALIFYSGLSEWGAAIAGIVILLALIPLMFYVVNKLGHMGHKVWEDHKNEIDGEFYRPRFEARKPDYEKMAEESQQRGRYDMEVENLLSSRQTEAARKLCEERLAVENLDEDRSDMYRRYIRVIDEQL